MKTKAKPPPDLDRLNELLEYDPATGEIKWKVDRPGTARAGTVAGNIHPSGYRQIKIDGTHYFAHRLAWKLHGWTRKNKPGEKT